MMQNTTTFICVVPAECNIHTVLIIQKYPGTPFGFSQAGRPSPGSNGSRRSKHKRTKGNRRTDIQTDVGTAIFDGQEINFGFQVPISITPHQQKTWSDIISVTGM
jgi:hypothetical protein